jgi:membrane protein required for colicin V production
MSPIDVGAIVIILLAALRCAYRGFVDEFFSVAAFIGAGYCTFFFWKPVGAFVAATWALSRSAAIAVAIIAVFLFAFVLVKVIGKILRETIDALDLESLDGFLGFLLGLVEGLLIVFLLALIIVNLPMLQTQKLYAESFFLQVFKPFLDIKSVLKNV